MSAARGSNKEEGQTDEDGQNRQDGQTDKRVKQRRGLNRDED
jgi:hypothetical protein